ncbi:MAG: twin-arginine translocase subunit TatB [Alphaproteobacteria bacterium]|nr:MAG: twin-arginine translocase subunit TatB [Alphaproteobacteria bacterium]
MFGVDSSELLIIAVVALVVIGPKDLPRVMRTIGQFVGRARGMAKHFRSGLDTMMRESELEEMEKKWKADNERIMREFPAVAAPEPWPAPLAADPASPAPEALPPPPAPPPPSPKASRPKAPPPRGAAPARAAAQPRPRTPPADDSQ